MKRLSRKRVDQIATADVMAVLIPHWHTKSETMGWVRQRIGAIMKWPVAQGYRDDNLAGDAISAALPKTGTVRKHRRALAFADVGAALDKVKTSGAFKSTVLAMTACRSGEVRLAIWDEVDLGSETWRVPASRMKAKRNHRVPLPVRALEILREAGELSGGSGLVFPSAHGHALSDNTISKLLRDLGIEAVPHGFRSSFRDWAAGCSDAPREACDLALAQVNSDQVEVAYPSDRPVRAATGADGGFVGICGKTSLKAARDTRSDRFHRIVGPLAWRSLMTSALRHLRLSGGTTQVLLRER